MNMRYAGLALIILLAGCSASHTASQTSVLPGAPSLTPQGVDPFNLNTKNIIHKYPLPIGSNAFFMATGSDKNVWFTEDDGSRNVPRIGKITQTGAVTEYAIPSGNGGNDIASGASGSLWFTEYTGTAIGKITTAGDVTEFSLPAGKYAFGRIAKGPDGNMWFTDVLKPGIGKITPTGTVTEFPLPISAVPGDIIAGPDGNLWFTEQDNMHSVGRITTGGTISEFFGTFSVAIAAGPDGNLYATSGYRLLQVTTAGEITEFPTGCSNAVDIILGPDKQMWTSECEYGLLQEFNTTTHVFSGLIDPDPSYNSLGGLAVGGDGDVWIADTGGDSILVYEEKLTTIGIRLNGELSLTDPNYGFELGYAVGTSSTQTQTISLSMGESVHFKNVDTEPHSAAFLGNATSNSAPWPGSFNGSTLKSPAGTAIGTAGWATGSLNPNKTSPIYETGLPGFYMIGCQYHYNTNEMRTVIVVH